MTPERLREIERLFHAAREQPPAERDAWLARACADDPALRREVESLLAQAPAGVLDAPVGALVAGLVAPARVLLAGRRIGGFEVQGLLGVGGMGEVYRARDTRLGRDVAIKILPRAFKDDPHRLARFEREARVLASLNHPHIGAIYGLEDARRRHRPRDGARRGRRSRRSASREGRSRSPRRCRSHDRSPTRSKRRTSRASSTGI